MNVMRNLWYKKRIKLGCFKKVLPASSNDKVPPTLFNKDNAISQNFSFSPLDDSFNKTSDDLLKGYVKLFFWDKRHVGKTPEWFFHDYKSTNYTHWSEVKLNENLGEDVKLTWDLSRFHWMQQLACRYKVDQNELFLDLINAWFVDWSKENPKNLGVNWSCGQECSIRIIHILNTTKIIGNVPCNVRLLTQLVEGYARRIKSTVGYAVSQDNNHGVTEAAALFICGAWLLKNSNISKSFSQSVISAGRAVLENRVSKLIMPDGGFSMYSTNYHRVVLNTLSIVEIWRKELDQPVFTEQYGERCRSAISWLYLLVDDINGDIINLGANDGSNPFIVQTSDYRDYRPSIQFASVTMLNKKAYSNSAVIDEPLLWLGVKEKLPLKKPCVKESKILKDSGIVVLFGSDIGASETKVFIKYPNYTFRPGQSDALHVDLWHNQKNILRDAGSYSYNGVLDEDRYFSSIGAHNTVQIDSIEPMPKVGPFLRSHWSKMRIVGGIKNEKDFLSWSGEYNIKPKATHAREVTLSKNVLKVFDDVNGADGLITLRWRLISSSWELHDDVLTGDGFRIEVLCKENFSMALKSGFESRYYNQYEEVPVLEITVNGTFTHITTNIYLEA